MSTNSSKRTLPSRRRPALIAAAGAAVVLALSTTGTLAAMSATIQNSVNTAGMGSLLMTETGPDATGTAQTCATTVSATSITCSTINKYGGNLAMTTTGATNTKSTTITIANPGTVTPATFTLTPGACTLTNNGGATGDLCTKALVTIVQDGTTIVSGVTPAQLAASTPLALTSVAAGGNSSITVTVSMANADNTVMGESISQPLTWTFNA